MTNLLKFLKRAFSREQEQVSSQTPRQESYLLPILYHEGAVYLGGYQKHPFSDQKDLPGVLEFPPLTSLEEIYDRVFTIVQNWVGVRPESVHLLPHTYPMQPLSNGTLTVALANLPSEPQLPNLIKHPLSNLTMVADRNWLTKVIYTSIQELLQQDVTPLEDVS